jgi:hypothetical protein
MNNELPLQARQYTAEWGNSEHTLA